MLKVVSEESKFEEDFSRGVVVVESDNTANFGLAIEELGSTQTRTLAAGFAAQKGMGSPRINGNVGPAYPVNVEGKPLEAVRGDKDEVLPLTHPKMRPAAYRIDVPLTRPLL